ncbi:MULTISPECIES: hypothetical protein [unclassified Sporosarcina]|uniref:hypothetical protein n=1 Tax=unclassified Sporosarcina TaxID=2647733 RepID=UPI000C168512|nr:MULTISPECIES: hypothetical protein [unclassified Sporosarcina]PID00462.1 hypothetical protein CSV68_02745 [Sporosarcina sp. P29]PID05751.1 hypothetical protein CSV66_08205 [Sporosarcina sp. P30]PID08945.1 hypothetical protein CSV65_08205 [Sporosarcina sp. P31]PID12031.1 hypothetical protein CSV64_08750 [Sporosarcina sp. P32b]
MEQLIILGIMLALGSLFGKKKDKDQQNQQKQQPKRPPSQQWPAQPTQSEMKQREPQRTNAAPVEKPRSLKELSRNLFEDIQKEFQDLQQEGKEPEQPVKAQAPQSEVFYAEPKKPVKPVSTPRPERQMGRGRLRGEEQSILQEDEKILQEDLIPRTPQQIMQGIVYAEILGPPKSKR